ncbi:DUF1365 domain-containing protein [Kitasatospora nipponensis]|uniref:DUF1365 domain-containing protein n=1 Tax=Kitasatospora nipponensis TaxID=258049 RepID=A0ABN1WT28_9ACTN
MTVVLPGRWGAALYEVRIDHVRHAPLRHAFRHRGYLWLVDLDRLPRLPAPLRPLARFRAADHPAEFPADHPAGLHAHHPTGHPGGHPRDPGRGLRRDLECYLAGQGVRLDGGQVLMLTQARSLGHVFNPLTVYWCHDRAGRPLCTVAEVHNTYGEQHRYLLRPDAGGRAESAKRFYVSPFFPVDGDYTMVLPEPGERLGLAISLRRDGGRVFSATVHGRRRPAGPVALLRAVARHPFATFAVSLHIRYQGIRLLLRGLPVQPRPPAGASCPVEPSPSQEEVPTP